MKGGLLITILFLAYRTCFGAYAPNPVINWININNAPVFDSVAYTGSYRHISDTPHCHMVAFTGNYNDLENLPATDTSNKILHYNESGRDTATIKVWNGIITPSVATGQTVDISSAGFSSITNIQLTEESTAGYTGGGTLKSEITARSNTTLTMNITKSNSTLSLGLLLGVAFIPATDLGDVRIHVEVKGK